jgi:hypothetical protein
VVSKYPGKSSSGTNTKTPSLTRSDSRFVTICTLDVQEYYFEGIDPPREKTPPSTLPPLFPPTEGQPFSSGAVPSKLPPLDSPTVPSNPAPVPLSTLTPPTDHELYTIIVQMQQMLAQQAEELAHLRRSLYQHQQITSPSRKKPHHSSRQSSRSTSPSKSDTSMDACEHHHLLAGSSIRHEKS